MLAMSESFLWASLVWGSVGSGYLLYGWKQKEPIPLLGGVLLLAGSYFIDDWLWMSLFSVAAIIGVFWLLHRLG